MSVTSGSPTQSPTAVGTSAELTGIVDTDLTSGDMASTSSGGLAMWTLDKASTATLAANVVATKSGLGRWILTNTVLPGANGTYAVDTLAQMPALGSVPNGTWIYVRSQKSWYWTGTDPTGVAAYLRLVVPNRAWQVQLNWGLDTVNGDDENLGTVAAPLKTWAEFRARMPALNANVTMTVAVGSALGAGDAVEYQPVLQQTVGGVPVFSLIGTRALGANIAVVASSDEAGNASPLIDLGIALTPGAVLQATTGAQTGATTTVQELVGGTSYRTTRWGDAAGTAVAPPAPADNVAIVTLITVSRFAFASPHIIAVVNGFDIATVDVVNSRNNVFQVCRIGGSLSMNFPTFMQFDRCVCLGNSFVGMQAPGVTLLASLTGFVRAGGGVVVAAVTVTNGGRLQLTNCLLTGGGGLDIATFGQCNANHTGVFDTPATAIDVHNQGYLNVTSTLYGANNAGKGTKAREGGRINVLSTTTPTLASVGQELELDGAAVANPVAAGVPAAAAAMVSWANWAAAPFARNVVSYSTGASIGNQT